MRSRTLWSLLVVSVSALALSLSAFLGVATYRQLHQPDVVYAQTPSLANMPITDSTVPNVVAKANGAVVEITDQVPSLTPFGPVNQEFLGSGFIISPDGYIITNQHVINNANHIMVKIWDRPLPVPAHVVGADYNLDLALLKVDVPGPLPYLTFANPSSIRVGQFAVAIGNPEALYHTVTLGIVSAEGRPIQAGSESGSSVRQYYNLIQTDAAINPGNSGGPLLNLAGQVIGVNTATSTSGQGLGFAIPVSTVLHALPYLKEGKQVPEPWLGVGIADVTSQLASQLGLPEPRGALVEQVWPHSPAARAGIRPGDVVLQFGSTPIYTADDLINAVQSSQPGQTVTVQVWRHRSMLTLTVTVGQMPPRLQIPGGQG